MDANTGTGMTATGSVVTTTGEAVPGNSSPMACSAVAATGSTPHCPAPSTAPKSGPGMNDPKSTLVSASVTRSLSLPPEKKPKISTTPKKGAECLRVKTPQKRKML